MAVALTLILLCAGGDLCDDLSTEAFEIAIKPVVANVVALVEAHNLKTSSSHCGFEVEEWFQLRCWTITVNDGNIQGKMSNRSSASYGVAKAT